jgi:hypothetical protein
MSISPASLLVKDVLVASPAIGTFNATSGWAITVAYMPDDKPQCICLKDTYGMEYPYLTRSITPMRRENVQAQVRCAGYATAYAKAMDIVERLRTSIPTGCMSVHLRNGPIDLGFDDKQRAILSLNFIVTRHA